MDKSSKHDNSVIECKNTQIVNLIDAAIEVNPKLESIKDVLLMVGDNAPVLVLKMLLAFEQAQDHIESLGADNEKDFDYYAKKCPADLVLIQENFPEKFDALISAKVDQVRKKHKGAIK
jgi:hypothetical protein